MIKSNPSQAFFRILIYITIFLIPFYFFRFYVFGLRTNIFELFVALTYIVFVFRHVNNYTIRKFQPISIWVYLFLFASLVGLFVAEDKTHALGIFKGWFLFPVILYVLVVNNFNKKNINKLSIPLYISLITVCSWAILQKFGVIGQHFYQAGDSSFKQYILEGRAFGPFESPNYLAMYLVPMLFLSLPILREIKNRYLKAIIILSYLFPLSALYFTTSRGGAVALATSIIAFLLFLYFKSKVFRGTIEKQSNVLIFGLIFVATIFLIGAVREIAPNQGGDNIRIEIYKYSITLTRENPITGIGLGSFQEKIDQISSDNGSFQAFGIRYALHPHNLFLAMWLNLGIIGLLVFLALLGITIKNLFKNKSEAFIKSCIFAALIAILVHGLFDTTYFKNDLSSIFWLIFAMSFLLSLANKSSEKN